MKLPNWIILCALLVGTMGHYSVNAVASIPAFSGNFQDLTAGRKLADSNMASETAIAPLNINKASAQELSTLPGIGAKKALAIVKYRELNGKFLSVAELVNVKGIGPKMMSKLDGYLSV
ncbi:MAG: competence protein ComEA [Kangiellaceae bacterium]|jgi:competence protein ComEA